MRLQKLQKTNSSFFIGRPLAALAVILSLCTVSKAQSAPAPTITNVSPNVATPIGGSTITITGTNFVTGAVAAFGANNATKTVFVNKTTLRATTPPSPGNAEGAVNVTVMNPDTQSATLPNAFTYQYPAPTITGVSPATDPPTGGNTITITGTGFLSGAVVSLGGINATKTTFQSKTSLAAILPASPGNAEGMVNVTVTNPDSQTATLPNGFTYQYPAPTLTSVSPTSATPAGGTTLTITGTNFVTGAVVTIGGISSKTTFVSKTSLRAVTPASPGSAEGPVNVTVTNPDSQAATLSNGFTYSLPAPTITSITPTVASSNGGTTITITGNNFLPGATAGFGAYNATKVTFVSKTSLKAVFPSTGGAESNGVTVWVTNPDGQTATLPQGLMFHLPPVITSVSPANGNSAGGYNVNVIGTYFRSGAVVTFGTTPSSNVIFNNNTSLTVTVPPGTGIVNVTETNTDGFTTTLTNGFSYSSVSVTQVSPSIGPLAGGNTVTITGTNFTSTSTVTFGTTAATSVTYVSPTSITAVAPAHAGGLVTVSVANSNGTGILPSAFQYTGLPIVASVTPALGALTGGTSVTLKGYNLKTVTQVMFGSNPASIVSTASGVVVVNTPAFTGGANPVSVTATDPVGSGTLPAAYSYQLSILTQGLDDSYAGFPYYNALSVVGGTAPYAWSITSGSLPAGLSLNASTGLISGTPGTAYGAYTIGLQVQDSAATPNVASTSLTFNNLFGFSTQTIPASFFGMIIYDQTQWPTVPVGALGKGLATTWPFIEQTKGVYNWTALDEYVQDAQSHLVPGGNTPVTLYWTNANVPQWAAVDPTTCTIYAGTTVSACTSMVANIQDFQDFMTALVTRYYGLIQTYELWNEPNVANVWTGSYADMVTLTSTAYNVIRQIDPSATILSPSSTAAPYLQTYLTTPGAPTGVDGIAIHGYPNVSQQDVPEAITGFKSVNIKLAMLQVPGVGVKPIWDTESSWGGPNSITDPDMRTGFVARSFLLHWSAGIHNMYWYGWDSPVWGTLYYAPPGVGMTPAAYAYQYTYNWMVGAAMPTPCTANGGSTYSAVYTCQLTRSGGYQALAVWDTNQTCSNGVCTYSSFTPPNGYIQYRDLAGNTIAITPGVPLKIGAKPILLENMPAPNVTNNPPPPTDWTFSLTGVTPNFAATAAANPYYPMVPLVANQAPGGTPAPGQVTLNNLIVMPGMSAPITGTSAVDSDANIAVGITQVMQYADFGLQIYTKQGVPIGNGVPGNLFWSGGSPCYGGVGADGIVQFDKLASRWVVGMRSQSNTECIAVSQTSDATGVYNEYYLQYIDPNNPTYQMDYPKIGVWPNGYYLTFDMLNSSYIPQYAVVCALERPSMVFGSPNAQAVCIPTQYSNNTGFFHLVPADLDSATSPPTGELNTIYTFAKPVNSAQYHLYGYQFNANFANPAASVLTGPVQLDTNAFAGYIPACDAGAINCVPQPSPGLYPLDAVGGYLMGRASYRNFGTYESVLLSQAMQTSKTSSVGVRWYELRGMQSMSYVYQSGYLQALDSSTNADGFSRWMSSAAQDSQGNIAMGYSISGAGATSYYSGFPGVAIDGRTPSTPLGSLMTEEIVFPGVSSEEPPVGDPQHVGRWGAVSGMSLDPVDQCTFWFVGQYEPSAGIYNWSTEIVSFTMPGCQQ